MAITILCPTCRIPLELADDESVLSLAPKLGACCAVAADRGWLEFNGVPAKRSALTRELARRARGSLELRLAPEPSATP